MRMQNWVHCTIIELDLLVSLGGRQVHRGSTAAYLSICFVRNLGLNHDGVKNVRGNTCVVAPFLREDAMDIVSFFVTNRGPPFLLSRRGLWRLCRCYAQTNPRAASYFSTAEHMCGGSATSATSFFGIAESQSCCRRILYPDANSYCRSESECGRSLGFTSRGETRILRMCLPQARGTQSLRLGSRERSNQYLTLAQKTKDIRALTHPGWGWKTHS